MTKYTHHFVETYKGFIGFGWDRETDENSIICYLQMLADDNVLKTILNRLADDEINEIQLMINQLLKKHLTDSEYHQLFLKDEHV
jgi:hypothetical protein